LIDQFHFPAVFKCFNPFFVWHFVAISSGENLTELASPSCIIFVMVCPTAKILFENYANANAAMEQFAAADTLATLVGQRGQFEEAKKRAEQA
jgi:dolichol kinase